MSELFNDLLAAQKEMPALQKSAINPHFKNKYVPLEELLQTIIPILNKHNFVLLQYPCVVQTDTPGLSYELLHVSGERIGGTMLLMAAKDDPQGQGSAITYARRYSLMSLLGLTADADDDAEATRTAPRPEPRGGHEYVREQDRVVPKNNGTPAPECPQGHGLMKLWPAGMSKAGKPVSANYKCTNKSCDNGSGWPESIWKDKWEDQLSQQLASSPTTRELEESLPFE